MSTTQSEDLNTSLASLTMLSLRLREGKDYLDYLHGFVIEAIRASPPQFDSVVIQKKVESEFGLKIPAATFAIYLKRLVKEKMIEPIGAGLQFHAVDLPNTTIPTDRTVAKERITKVTEELARFASSHSLKWDVATCSNALADFLRRYSIDFLRFAESKSPLPPASSGKEDTSYIVAAFITNTEKKQTDLFESIKVLVQSHILANALMCPDLKDTTRGFNNVHFLLDTRLLIKSLDLESQYDTDNTRTLFAAIRRLKGVLCVFNETKNELRTVIRAIIRGMQHRSGRGPVYHELLKRGRGVEHVIFAESNLDTALAALSISVLPSPGYSEDTYQFEIGQDELRDEIYNEIPDIRDSAIDHDTRVVRNIFALRKGRHVSRIEDARYVFLTTNSALSRAAFSYERKNSDGWIFSPVVTDFHLSHLVWLKSPMAASDLSRTEILANCYATMKPDASIWNRLLVESDRLRAENKVSELEHEALRYSLKSPDELMDVTRGDIEGVNPENIHKILERLEKSYAAQKEQELQQARQSHEETKRALAEAQSLAQSLETKQISALNQTAAQEQEVQRLQKIAEEARERESRRNERVQRIAKICATVSFAVSLIVFAVLIAFSLMTNYSLWFGVPSVILGVLGLAEFSVPKVKDWVRSKVEKLLSKLIG